jgi:hypothetical protein
LTKPESIESALKIPLAVEETSRINLDLDVGKLMGKKVAKFHSPQVFVEQEPKPKVVRAKKATRPRRSRLFRATQRLYNLELGNESEKSLNIELNLYQMETY